MTRTRAPRPSARDESSAGHPRPGGLRRLWSAGLTSVYDVAIAGSGFAGSLLAMIARRQGRSVILLEKGRHPRFAIGESSTPLSNLLLESLALRYNLPGILPLAKWGTWQHDYPNLDCGIKRGFSLAKPTTTARTWPPTRCTYMICKPLYYVAWAWTTSS